MPIVHIHVTMTLIDITEVAYRVNRFILLSDK